MGSGAILASLLLLGYVSFVFYIQTTNNGDNITFSTNERNLDSPVKAYGKDEEIEILLKSKSNKDTNRMDPNMSQRQRSVLQTTQSQSVSIMTSPFPSLSPFPSTVPSEILSLRPSLSLTPSLPLLPSFNQTSVPSTTTALGFNVLNIVLVTTFCCPFTLASIGYAIVFVAIFTILSWSLL